MRMRQTLCGLASAALIVSCNVHPLTPLGDTLYAGRIEVSAPLGSNAVDILWLVDSSGSMAEEQAELGAKFDAFIDELVSIGADFRLAVVTTDTRSRDASGRFQTSPGGFVAAGCTRSTPELEAQCAGVQLDDPFLDVRDYTNADRTVDIERLRNDFECIASVGDCGNAFEAGLDAISMAVAPDMIAAEGFNSGFFRDNAFLAVVMLTDEDDCSGGSAFSPATDVDCYVSETRAALTPVQRYYDELVALKDGAEDRVLVAGIIGPDDFEDPPTRAEYAASGVRFSCNSSLGGAAGTQSARDGERYRELITLAGDRGIEESICQGDFTVALRKIGEIIRASLDVNCLNDSPRTCTSSRDCAEGVDCINPGDLTVGSGFCADFELALEIAQPEDPGSFSPYVGPGPAGSEPNPAAQYTVDYDSAACRTGVSFTFGDGQRPPPGGVYRLTYPVDVDLITAGDTEGTLVE